MRCLLKYDWVKLYRDRLPEGKGIMGAWAKLASRAAFRKGHASYCGHINAVSAGMWSGGIVGLKSILGVKSRAVALETLDKLQELGYLRYSLNSKTKKLTYKISDWVVKCSGAGCMDGAVYATEGYGFLCLSRNITQRLVDKNYIFDEADAWLDLWCHTVSEDPSNAFSFLAPAVQFRYEGALLTLEKLGQRWGWEKTKVWRFFKKHGDVFTLYRLPGSYGCLVFNTSYPMDTPVSLPEQSQILRILDKIRTLGANAYKVGSDHKYINRLIAWYSKYAVQILFPEQKENRVALSAPIYNRAYFSHCWNCKNCRYDCSDSSYSLITKDQRAMKKNKQIEVPSIEEVQSEIKRVRYNKRYYRILRSTVNVLIVTAAIAALIATLVLPVVQITGTSMEPTLHEGDIVVLVKTDHLKRGDLCAFSYSNKILIKRVIGLPGDYIDIDSEGNVSVNGKVIDEPYVVNKSLGDADITFPFQVPESQYFMMGDQRDISIDSRNTVIGCITTDQMVGKILFKVWPLSGGPFVD